MSWNGWEWQHRADGKMGMGMKCWNGNGNDSMGVGVYTGKSNSALRSVRMQH